MSTSKPNRKASALLQVMLPPDDLERYKQLATAMGFNMRQLVQFSIEGTWDFYMKTTGRAPGEKPGRVEVEQVGDVTFEHTVLEPNLNRRYLEHDVRVSRLEAEMVELRAELAKVKKSR